MATRVELFKGRGLHPWFIRLRADNGQIVAASEGYLTKWNAKRAARKTFPDLELIEVNESGK